MTARSPARKKRASCKPILQKWTLRRRSPDFLSKNSHSSSSLRETREKSHFRSWQLQVQWVGLSRSFAKVVQALPQIYCEFPSLRFTHSNSKEELWLFAYSTSSFRTIDGTGLHHRWENGLTWRAARLLRFQGLRGGIKVLLCIWPILLRIRACLKTSP